MLFTHAQVVEISNLYECLCSAEHKVRYYEEYGKQSSSGSYIYKKNPTMEVNSAPKQPGYKLSSKYLPYAQQNKYIHTDLELLEDE